MVRFPVFCFLLLCFLTLNAVAYAQHISGTVFDDQDNTPLQSAVILNKRTGNLALSDQKGMYRLHAKYGDTLNITLVSYEPVSFTVKETKQEFVQNIYLRPEADMLETFEVSTLTPYQRDSLARRNLYNAPLNREWISGGRAVFSPATALAQQFSRKTKQRRRFQLNYNDWENQRYIESRYTAEFVAAVVPLHGDTLVSFINNYPIAADFARAATDLELKMWIRYNYLEWEKNPKLIKLDDIKTEDK
ncbi:MAG: carboxypeptidase-like regulatory domain-containing protein [Sphingobacteriales bacterium]|nr:MAG: carboxypeptidase-like regulatory domain-containing protein [Sphingobacteriales bacterium]